MGNSGVTMRGSTATNASIDADLKDLQDCTGKPSQAMATRTSSWMVWTSYAGSAWTIYELG